MKRREFVQKVTIVSTGASLVQNKIAKFKEIPGESGDQEQSPSTISIVAPSTIQVNEPFSVGIRMLTDPYFTKWGPDWSRTGATVNGPFNKSPRGIHFMDNVLPAWKGSVRISGSDGFTGRAKYSFSEGTGPYQKDHRPIRRLEGFRFSKPGVKYIKVVDPVSGIEGVSNAIKVSHIKMEDRLFWGDTHCHSIFGDGVRTPEELHAFARDEAFLDVFSHTEHTEAITDDQWDYFSAVANRFNEPGKFVTFIGGEWTSKPFGHRNFLYPGATGPVIRSSDENQNTLEELFDIVRKHKGLVVANHPKDSAFIIDFDTYHHDPEVERLVEMYSIGGSHERPSPEERQEEASKNNSVVDGLKKGHKLGMIGVGDTHDGRPGDALHEFQLEPEGYRDLEKPGLTGIWAKDLSRESIFDALWNRRVYATTHHRTIVKFSMNGSMMGSTIRGTDGLTVEAEIASNLSIEKIELISNGEVMEATHPSKKAFTWNRNLNGRIDNDSWVYVRVTLEENNYAWTSPIWILNG